MSTIISLTHIKKSYKDGFKKKKVIHDFSLNVEPGEVFGFIGPNGAGKSTIINLLMGFIIPDSGKATINGIPPDQALSRDNIGYLPEDPRFYENLTAEELLLFGGRSSGVSKIQIQRAIPELLAKLELIHVKNKQVKTYSKGMKQRLGLGIAMIHDPSIYILDEPMSGLDPIGRNLLKNIILELKEKGKTIFFSTHILNDVEILCDRIGIINHGKMMYCGAMESFATHGQNFEKAFISLVTQHQEAPVCAE